MAEAKKITKEVMKPINEDHIVLEMNMDEARAVNLILRTVAGCPFTTGRRFTDRVSDVLWKAGAHVPYSQDYLRGSISWRSCLPSL